MPKIAILQMQSGIDPEKNAADLCTAIEEAARQGATMLFAPEMCMLLDSNRARSADHLHVQKDDPNLKRVCVFAGRANIWVQLGSMALAGDTGERRRNCSIVINNSGKIVATYDKIHLFDVNLESGESWRESAAYAPGEGLSLVDTPLGKLGLSVCYDIRFAALYTALSNQGAQVLTIPAAFTVPTGEAHWHTLLRARAIENAAFVVAAAQTGSHEDGRETFGHSLVVDPWGTILLDMGKEAGLAVVDIDLDQVTKVRSRIPVINHRRALPEVRTFP